MATRKSRQNTESPTPSGTESVPTTPTTPATRNTRSIRNKQLQQGKTEETPIQIKTEKIDEEEEAVKETARNDEEVSAATATLTATTATTVTTTAATPTNIASEKVDVKESTEQQTDKEKETSPPAASTRKRRIAAAKEENTTDKSTISNESVSPNTPDDGKTSPTKIKRSRRNADVLLTDSRADLVPSILSKRRNSTGKIERPTRKLSSRIKKLKQLRKTKMGRALLRKPSEKIANVINKPLKQLIEKQSSKGAKIEKSDSASDSELIKMSRRRSDSVSKCSDMTDASSFQETKDSVEDLAHATESNDASKVVVKEEIADKDEASEIKAPESDLVETARSANDSGIGGDSDNSQVAKQEGDQTNDGRRSSRRQKGPVVNRFPTRPRPSSLQRVMNTRSQSGTPKEVASETQDDDEDGTIASKEVKSENADSPLHIDTTASETNVDEKLTPNTESTDKEKTTEEKAKSLSPVLVSEGVSEISVKQFYGQADFLENNLGIEKDPKLGEIVQSHEKIKAGNKEKTVDIVDSTGKAEKDCEKPSEVTKQPSETNKVEELETSTESMEDDDDVEEDDEDVEAEKSKDGAKCDEKDSVDCFVKPVENVRRDSATILNESLLVWNGEIELTSTKKEKKDVIKNIEELTSDVVLYKISNGIRVNPEKLEKVLEIQKIREKERSDSTESVENGMKDESKDKKDIEIVENSAKIPNKDDNDGSKSKAKHTESLRSNSTETKAAVDNDTNKENLVKPAAVRSNSSSKDSRSSSLDDESPEERIQKESHLKTLGLLTHQAAEEATIEKQKQREKFKEKNKGKKNSEYTGTLKTVIKLHRGSNDKKKGNQSLKMTLHKGRAKNGSDKSDSHSTANSEEDTYYTIHQQDMDSIGK